MIQRILVRHGVCKDIGSLLLADMKTCVEYFKDNLVGKPLKENMYGGYKH